jgi:hypothetical protein
MDKQKPSGVDIEPVIQLSAEELLANAIVNRLIKQEVLSQTLAEETFYGLSEGKLGESDWRLIAEKTLIIERRNGE